MDHSIRNTPGLISRIERIRDELIKHFEALISLAGVERSDRTATAVTQYQMQVETSALIHATENFQTLIRQLQEMWLFGQLDTVGESKVQQQTDENAKTVASLLKQLLDRQTPSQSNGVSGGALEVEMGETAEAADSVSQQTADHTVPD